MDDISGDLTNSCPINERNMYIIYCYYLINNPLQNPGYHHFDNIMKQN